MPRGRAAMKARGMPSSSVQERFCREYIKDYNVSAAARRAGYKEPGNGKFYELVTRLQPYIQKLHEQRSKVIAEKLVYDDQDVLEGYTRVLRANAQDYVELVNVVRWEGKGRKRRKIVTKVERLRSILDLTPAEASVISSLSQGPGGRITYTLEDKAPARAIMAKHHGLINDKLIQEHKHRHMHLHADLSHVSSKELKALEERYLKAVGKSGLRLLGIMPGMDEGEQSGS